MCGLLHQESYAKCFKTKTVRSVEFVGDRRIKPRYSPGETKSEREIENLINSGELEKGTAVIWILAVLLVWPWPFKLVGHGFQPVIMFDSVPHTRGINSSEQELATLLYFGEQIDKLKRGGKIKSDAPPVFILDAHRDDMDVSLGKTKQK